MASSKSSLVKVVFLEGNIAAGKSSLLFDMPHYYGGGYVKKYPEPLEKLTDFNGRNLLKTNNAAFKAKILTEYINIFNDIKSSEVNPDRDFVVIERSPLSNKIFIEARRANIINGYDDSLFEVLLEQCEVVYGLFCKNFKVFHVYLDTSPEECFLRLKQRARPGEEICTVEYLRELRVGHDEFFGNCPRANNLEAFGGILNLYM